LKIAILERICRTIENKRIVEHIFAELAKDNPRPLLDGMAEDFRFVVIGSTRWSRAYEGKQAVLDELFAPLMAAIDGRLNNTAFRFIADDDFVVVEARGNNRTKRGMQYNNAYCNVLRLEDGKLKEWTEYSDTRLVADVLGDPAEWRSHAT
jgi:ketosteroid isomerase-like protein